MWHIRLSPHPNAFSLQQSKLNSPFLQPGIDTRFALTVECVNRKHNNCNYFCRRLRPKSSSHFLLLFLNDHAQKFVAEALQCIHGIRLRSNQDLPTFLVHATWRLNTSRAAASGKRPPDCSSATPTFVRALQALRRSTGNLSLLFSIPVSRSLLTSHVGTARTNSRCAQSAQKPNLNCAAKSRSKGTVAIATENGWLLVISQEGVRPK